MHAAAPRPSRMPLWRHLRATQPAERLAPLEAMLNRADIATPYQFLEELLTGPLDGRRKLIRRLGHEARDPIEELLGAALDFETLSAPSLQLRSEEHTSELQSLMRISYSGFCLKKKNAYLNN